MLRIEKNETNLSVFVSLMFLKAGEGGEKKNPFNRRVSNATLKDTSSSLNTSNRSPATFTSAVVGRAVADKTPDNEEVSVSAVHM